MRLPAEWEPQAGVMLTWPHDSTDWRDDLDAVLPVFAAIGAAVSRHVKLLSVCQSAAHVRDTRQRLLAGGAESTRLHFSIAASNDTWARDHGPLTVVVDGLPVLRDYVFNGWGGKFAATLDSAITSTLHANGTFGTASLDTTGLVLEGGAVETDGAGTLLATHHSVVSETRNPGLSRTDIEQRLRAQLGITRFHWIEHGRISGDDTDGHIDTLARFTDRDTIAHATAPPGDADHASLRAMADELSALRKADGTPYRLVPLPFPGVHHDGDGHRLPATYANFLIVDDAVLVPVYGVAQDTEALDVLQRLFPGREVIPIDCLPIIRQNASVHCLTMHFPAQLALQDTWESSAA